MGGLTSAASFIALLDEEQAELKYFALEKLNSLVDEFWPEVASDIQKVEELYEDESFPRRELAALVASKVYYHLGENAEAMSFALGAGKLFNVTGKGEYEETLVSKFIDEYVRLRLEQAEATDNKAVTIDPRLESIVMGMFDRCYQEGSFHHALGIAVEARLLDKVEETISKSGDVQNMLRYCIQLCSDVVKNRDFRGAVLRIIVKLYKQQADPDYSRIVECLIFLDDSTAVVEILDSLIKVSGDSTLLAYQIAFDLCNNSTQQFSLNVRNLLPATDGEDKMEVDASAAASSTSDASTTSTPASPPSTPEADTYQARLTKLKTILTAETPINLNLEFLYHNNHTDMAILKNIKNAVETRNSVCHSATIFANAVMHAGTTRDTFLRENLEWLARATNWAKFSATAGLGVIHKGHLKEGLSLLGPYLPQAAGGSSSPYSEGGALYALGIIHANHGEKITNYLANALRNAGTNATVQHGACLGLGVAAMATGNESVYEDLKTILYNNDAVSGEAAGLAMGLVMLGSASDKMDEMLAYAHETQHEKIIRGLALGVGLVMYGREEGADTLIEQLILDKDPILRYGGMSTIGLAYCGTGNNSAIRRLLHVAVSDVSDDVRRAAVTNLGFLLSRQPERCPRMVALLCESYNPHVRYGATQALGIACAGSANKEALDLLEPLASDPVDFVRQGALIALAMVLIQVSKAQEPRVESIRKMFEEKITDKHEEVMCKFGAIIASGIIDAGGRNVTIALHSRSGHKNMSAIVGLSIFTQFWYWYPLIHFVSLAFTPTAIIGLNKDLKVPKFTFKSNARPSLFAYPPEVKPPTTTAPTKVSTAVLSYSRKAPTTSTPAAPKASTAKPAAAKAEAEPMDIDKEGKEKEKGATEEKEKEKEKKKKEPEPHSETKENPGRVTLAQLPYITFDTPDARYTPVKRGEVFGIVILHDNRPGEPEEFVAAGKLASGGAPAQDEEPEPEPPAPFQWTEA